MSNGQQNILINGRYLNLPVKTGVSKKKLAILIDGCIERRFEIELAESEPDFWVFVDASNWQGKTAAIEIEDLLDNFPGLESVECSDIIKGSENLYNENLRPQFHFTSKRGWLNDPNGLVYYKGEYHLFYQHNPYGIGWGNMHWGHAVSTDLLHWKEQPIALYQFTQAKGMCYSGSAVVDTQNSSGLQSGNYNTIVALFTDADYGEALAYSNDCGQTWTYANDNPVVRHEGRDPNVFWYNPGKHWVMAVYDVQEGKNGIAFYTSFDLKKWQRQSWIEGFYECPDIFELPIDNNPQYTKWVISGADGAYMIGSFDGKSFTPESGKIRYNYGDAYYAAQTYNDIPADDGRRIQIAWGLSEHPGMPFNQCMLFPVNLTLRTVEDNIRLIPYPIKEIDSLHGRKHEFANVSIGNYATIIDDMNTDCVDIQMEFSPNNASWIVFDVRGVPVLYDAVKQTVYCRGCVGPLKSQNGEIHLRILVDRSTFEIFGNAGELYMPISVIADSSNRSISVSGDSRGKASIDALDIYEICSVW